ncbi:MAG: Bug family tripartite tricarboxylate transporter substrate binding protein [Desulfopila sp.]
MRNRCQSAQLGRRLQNFLAVGLFLFVGILAQPVTAGPYPDQPIVIVVGSTPGSAPDTLARIISAKMGEVLGQPVVVENRPGAAGSVAASVVARAKADGYTLGLLTAVHSITPTLRKNAGFNLITDFDGVGMVASVPLIFVVNKDLGVTTMDEFIERAKKGDIFYSTPGIGTLQHLATQAFAREKGLTMSIVPYKGGGDATKAVISNEVQLFYAGIPPALPHVKKGTIVALGISTPKRSPAVPDVPTFQELGFVDYNVDNWHALVAPKGTPKEIIAKLSDALNTTLAQPETAEQFLNVGATPNPETPEEVDAWFESETARWKKIIEENNITLKE